MPKWLESDAEQRFFCSRDRVKKGVKYTEVHPHTQNCPCRRCYTHGNTPSTLAHTHTPACVNTHLQLSETISACLSQRGPHPRAGEPMGSLLRNGASSEPCESSKHGTLDLGHLSILHGVHERILCLFGMVLKLPCSVLLAERGNLVEVTRQVATHLVRQIHCGVWPRPLDVFLFLRLYIMYVSVEKTKQF